MDSFLIEFEGNLGVLAGIPFHALSCYLSLHDVADLLDNLFKFVVPPMA